MLVNFTMSRYLIGADATLSGKLKQARLLQVASGRVWLTIEGQSTDFWLSAGESIALPAHRLIVLQADQQDSDVRLSLQACAEPAANSRLQAHFASGARQLDALAA